MSARFLSSPLWWVFLFLAPAACHRSLIPGGPGSEYPDRPATDRDLDALVQDLGGEGSPALAAAAALGADELDAAAVRRLAVENSPAVLEAEARLNEAQAGLRAAGLWPNPELEGRLLIDLDGVPAGEAALLFPIPLGGRLGAESARAGVQVELARLDLALARRRALADAEGLLARLAHRRARLALHEDLSRRSQENAALARSRLGAFMADSVDVALILAEASHDRRAAARVRAEVAAAEDALRGLLGLRPGEGRFVARPLQVFSLSEADGDLERDCLARHPGVLRAALVVQLRDQQAAQAAAARVPDLLLGPALDAGADGLALGLSAGIALPILDTGRAGYERKLASRDAAVEGLRSARRAARSGLHLALARLRARQAELAELSGEPEQLVEDAVSLAEVRFRAGKLDVLKLLSIHRAQVSLQAEKQDLLLAAHEARLELERVVGRRVTSAEVQP